MKELDKSLNVICKTQKRRGEISLNNYVEEKKKKMRKGKNEKISRNTNLPKKKIGRGSGNHLGLVIGNKSRELIRPRILKNMINSICFIDLINYLSFYIQCSKDKRSKLIKEVLDKPECIDSLIVYMYKENVYMDNGAYKKILGFVRNFRNDVLSLDEFFIIKKTKSFTKKHARNELLPESMEYLKKFGYL